MSPNEAMKTERKDEVLKQQEKYANELGSNGTSGYDKLKISEKVLIKKEIRETKMNNEFEEMGTVTKILGSDTYEITTKNKKLTRHASQLKALSWGCWMLFIL